jgi:hypothetical protein
MIEFLEETVTGMFSTHGVDLSTVDNIFDEFSHSRLKSVPDAIEDDVMEHFTPFYNCYIGAVSIFMRNYEGWEIRELENYVSPLRGDTRFRLLFNRVGRRAATLFILFLFISEYIRCPPYGHPISIVDYIHGFVEGEQIC